MNKNNNIDYSSWLPYLIDANWLIGFIFLMIGKIIRKSIKKFITRFLGKEVVLQKVANRVVATLCYWKFNTEVAITEIFEKLCHLIIDQKVKK